MESKEIMELFDRLMVMNEKYVLLKDKVERLAKLIVCTERSEANYFSGGGYSYLPRVDVEDINDIFRWEPDEDAARIVAEEKAKREAEKNDG